MLKCLWNGLTSCWKAIPNAPATKSNTLVFSTAINSLFPPVSEQQEKARTLRTLEDKINANEEESRTLADIHDTLLPKLLSGEIRVKDAGKLMEVQNRVIVYSS